MAAVGAGLAKQYPVQPLYKSTRIFKLPTFGETGLIEDQLGQIGKARFVLLFVETLQQRVRRVDLQDRFGLGHGLTYVARAAIPMFFLMLLAALLSYYFQDVILWLPNRM